MSNQTPATISVLKKFTDTASAFVSEAKEIAKTKDSSAISQATKTAEETSAQVEKALEVN